MGGDKLFRSRSSGCLWDRPDVFGTVDSSSTPGRGARHAQARASAYVPLQTVVYHRRQSCPSSWKGRRARRQEYIS
eukprot:scaffold85065_cov35-Tisochrysis_lutea.AAC.2